jgi:hypothetical protein
MLTASVTCSSFKGFSTPLVHLMLHALHAPTAMLHATTAMLHATTAMHALHP